MWRPPVSTLVPYTTLFRSRADFAWPDVRLVVETDGRDTHLRRIAFRDDRVKDRALQAAGWAVLRDRKSTRLNSSHAHISYAVFCLIKTTPAGSVTKTGALT